MRCYSVPTRPLGGEVEIRGTEHGWDVTTVPGSKPGVFYTVDLTLGRCSCPAWTFQRGERRPCKHLRALGYVPVEGQENLPKPKKPKTPKGHSLYYSWNNEEL